MQATEITYSRTQPCGREDALLLREFSHRVANELSVAIAAVTLAQRGMISGGGADCGAVLAEARSRLENLAVLMRILATPVPSCVDVAADVTDLCRALLAARPEATSSRLELDLPETWVDGLVGRRIALIAAELIANACRHGLAGRSGVLSLRLRRVARELVLEVHDDGPGPTIGASTSGMGFGGGIVADLARLAGGSVELGRGRVGTVARLTVPMTPAMEMADAR